MPLQNLPSSPVLVYPSEQAVIDQVANGNVPFFRDFSWQYKWPQSGIIIPVGDSFRLRNDFILLPHPDNLPNLAWSLRFLYTLRFFLDTTFTRQCLEVFIQGSNNSDITTTTETPSNSSIAQAAARVTGTTDPVALSWLTKPHDSYHGVSVWYESVAMTGTPKEVRNAEVTMRGTLSILG